MEQQKEISKLSGDSRRYRYWYTPPETVCLKAADIESLIPETNRIQPFHADQIVELPAAEIFSRNIPKVSLELLARLLPAHVSPAEALLPLPVARLAAAYHLIEHQEELPPEVELPEIIEEESSKDKNIGELPEKPAAEAIESSSPSETDVIFENAAVKQSPETEVRPSSEPMAATDDLGDRAIPLSRILQGKTPVKPHGIFSSLPIFRRKPSPVSRMPEEPPLMKSEAPPSQDLPAAPENRSEAREQISEAAPAAIEIKKEAQSSEVSLPVRFIETEHISSSSTSREIPDQEPLQALFLTEENMTLDRVMELCGDLPGINSCVLTRGTAIIASYKVPEGVDLISMSAHAANMLHMIRDSSARMGVGVVPAVTLHTEKGVMSFFHRDDLTMLVFHKDRGFVPGVREKMAAVLGELAKCRLALPIGNQAGT